MIDVRIGAGESRHWNSNMKHCTGNAVPYVCVALSLVLRSCWRSMIATIPVHAGYCKATASHLQVLRAARVHSQSIPQLMKRRPAEGLSIHESFSRLTNRLPCSLKSTKLTYQYRELISLPSAAPTAESTSMSMTKLPVFLFWMYTGLLL